MKDKKLTKKDLNNLKKAQEKIEEKRKLPKEVLGKMNHRLFYHMIVAIVIVVYFYFIHLASVHIPEESLIIDLKVFSMITILITIFIFEYSYKKDSGILCVYGIESFFVALSTLGLSYLYVMQNHLFSSTIAWLTIASFIYYIVKSILVFIKMRREYYNSMSDIQDIVKKEK